ncbi:MAG TPA: glutathionylspermidine synthase family protein [Blastocatellia bacterium]|nr:glutathionylspermidine synthase family protein [Blastocatellia bacterium]
MTDAMPLPDYGKFARLLYATCIISDPWIAGKERFRLNGVVLTAEQAQQLSQAAERIGYLYHELTEVVLAHPELLDEFYALTPYQKAMWLESEGRWHGIARVDLFLCTDGTIKSCEMNSDTPSGEAEAVLLNELLHPYHPNTINPNVDLPERFWQMLVTSDRATGRRSDGAIPTSVAIIYPTDLPEDLSMIALYRQWLEARGCSVVIGSPYNLNRDAEGNVTVLGKPVDLIIRHYKTDWWGEREVIWSNQQPFLDAEPLERELLLLLAAEYERKVTVVNPFGSVVTQNKLSLALMWERQELFSPQAQEWIRAYIPETRRLATLDLAQLKREEWVLKSAYGCEGDSVLVGPFVKPNDWQLALTTAISNHWVAQRFFAVAPLEDGLLPNLGVYLIAGQAAGFYTRLAPKSTDYTSVTTPTFVQPVA